jgi:hypothetical protein
LAVFGGAALADGVTESALVVAIEMTTQKQANLDKVLEFFD